jgi:hypothetical protein
MPSCSCDCDEMQSSTKQVTPSYHRLLRSRSRDLAVQEKYPSTMATTSVGSALKKLVFEAATESLLSHRVRFLVNLEGARNIDANGSSAKVGRCSFSEVDMARGMIPLADEGIPYLDAAFFPCCRK